MSDQSGPRSLVGIDPVELPPPHPSGARPPSLALRAFVSVGLVAGFVFLSVGLVVGLIALNIVLWINGYIAIGAIILAIVVIGAVGKGLIAIVRRPPEPQGEVEIPSEAEPRLHAHVRDLADRVGTRPPDRVVMTSEVNAYVTESGPLLGLWHVKRTLAIGGPLLDILTVSHLNSVLAHELGHFSGRDTRFGPLLYRTDQATRRMIESLQGGARGFAALFLGYWKFQRRVSASVRRRQELVADQSSVRIAGRQAAADALHRIQIAARAEEVYRASYLSPLIDAGCRPTEFASGMRALLRDETRVEELSTYVSSTPEATDAWASHPPTPERIARIAGLTDPAELLVDTSPASSLWDNASRWTGAADEVWLSLVTTFPQRLRAVGWDAFADETAGKLHRGRASEVDKALTRLGYGAGIEGLRTTLQAEKGRALADWLPRWLISGVNVVPSVLTTAVVAESVTVLLDDGRGHFTFSWSAPVEFVDAAGTPILVSEAARQAVDGDWAPLDAILKSG